MNDTELKILEIFQKEPSKEHSTSEIVFRIEPDIIKKKEGYFDVYSKDKDEIRLYKAKKAKLHRKILYYLAKLVQNKVLKETRKTGKGEKFFELLLGDGEELILDKYGKRSMVIQRPAEPSIPIEGYEQEGIVKRLEASTWIERLNSILIECDLIETLMELEALITTSFSVINDVIAFNSFETFFDDYSVEQLLLFLNRVNMKCSDYGKKVCCVVDVSGIKNEDYLISLMRGYNESRMKNVKFVFEMEPRDLQLKNAFFCELISMFSKDVQPIYIKNKLIHKAPYFFGRAGAYTFDEKEWELYERELKGKMLGLVVSQATVMIDMHKFFILKGRHMDEFRKMVSNISRSFLETNSVQRSQSSRFFEDIDKFDNITKKNLFRFSKNYVRFWNYGWKNKAIDPEVMFAMLGNAKEIINQFCNYEETIYKSCGMPTRFRVAFSFLFEEAAENSFTKPDYEKFYIRDIKDFYDENLKKIIADKESLFKIFDGGDLITFYRKGAAKAEEVLREIQLVLNTFRLPFFRYDFKATQDTNRSLMRFMN